MSSPNVDPIAASIDAVLSAVTSDSALTIDGIMPSLARSIEFQRLLYAHLSNFLNSDKSISDKVSSIVYHSLWIGFEAGKAVGSGEKLEALVK